MAATSVNGGLRIVKEQTINPQDQFTLSLLTASLMQQHQMLRKTDALLRELMDRVDSVGDRLWQMDRRITASQVDQAGTRKRAAKKRRLARKQSAARKRSGK